MTPTKILILKPSSLGDVATALPLAVDLKSAFPHATIDWLIHPSLRGLVQGHPALNNLIDFDRKALGSFWRSPTAARKLKTLIHTLRSAHYDCVIDAQGLLRSGLLARLTGAPMRIGFASAREGATFFYTHKVKIPTTQISTVRMRALSEPLNIKIPDLAHAQVLISPAAAESIATKIHTAFPQAKSNYAVVIPGARWDTKRWSPDGFIDIIQRLIARQIPIVLAGSNAEAPLCATIAAHCGPEAQPHILNIAGSTSMQEMIALLAHARLVLGNDSGPLHVAAALEVPLVGIYGPTDPNFVGPYNQLHHVVRFAVDCHPCRYKICSHHSCMKGVEVEAVWDKITQVLNESTPPTPSHGATLA